MNSSLLDPNCLIIDDNRPGLISPLLFGIGTVIPSFLKIKWEVPLCLSGINPKLCANLCNDL